MSILVFTPLFPPDTTATSLYAKLLTEQLADGDVTTLLYGFLPESAPGATLVTIDKRGNVLKTLVQACVSLYKQQKNQQLVVVLNGPRTEFPALLLSFITKTPFLLIISDPHALQKSHTIYQLIHFFFLKRVANTLTLPDKTSLYIPQEILPFQEQNEDHSTQWWIEHVKEIHSYVTHK